MGSELQIKPLIEKWKPLLLGYSAIGGTLAGMKALFGLPSLPTTFVIGVALMAIWTAMVLYAESRPPRKRDRNKFGIGIFITTENEKVRKRLENDLITRLRDVIRSHNLTDFFEIVVATDAQATKYGDLLDRQRDLFQQVRRQNPSQSLAEKQLRPFLRFQERTGCRFFGMG